MISIRVASPSGAASLRDGSRERALTGSEKDGAPSEEAGCAGHILLFAALWAPEGQSDLDHERPHVFEGVLVAETLQMQ